VGRFANGRVAFQRVPDLFRFIALAALVSTVVAATVGVTSLALAGFAAWRDYPAIWITWWLGDLTGDLLIAPLLLLGINPASARIRGRMVELAALAAGTVVVGEIVFGGWLHPATPLYPIAFLCLPLLAWPALRFGPRETAAALFVVSAIAIQATLHGLGPFVRSSPNESLLLLQAFLGVTAVSALALAAAVAELHEAHRVSQMRVVERTRELEATRQRVAQSEILLSRAQQVAHVGSFRWDVAANRVTGSEELSRIYGRTPAECGGTMEGFLSCVHPDDRANVGTAMGRAIHERQPFWLRERIVRPDGEVRVLDSVADVARDAGGQVTELYGVCRDVTEEQRAEEELRTLAATLLQVQEDARRRIGSDLHDRTSPLLTALSTKLYNALYVPESRRSTLNYRTVLSQSLDLVDGVAAVVRTVSGSLHPPLLDDRGLLATLRWYLTDVVGKTGVHVSMDFPPTLPRLSLDVEVALFRVVQEGLVSLDGASLDASVQVRLASDPEGVTLEVRGTNRARKPDATGGGALLGLRDRIAQLGGRLKISAAGPESITVIVRIGG
jgi:PAS domain S-box-containing protein